VAGDRVDPALHPRRLREGKVGRPEYGHEQLDVDLFAGLRIPGAGPLAR
jgi:hypothetical protein